MRTGLRPIFLLVSWFLCAVSLVAGTWLARDLSMTLSQFIQHGHGGPLHLLPTSFVRQLLWCLQDNWSSQVRGFEWVTHAPGGITLVMVAVSTLAGMCALVDGLSHVLRIRMVAMMFVPRHPVPTTAQSLVKGWWARPLKYGVVVLVVGTLLGTMQSPFQIQRPPEAFGVLAFLPSIRVIVLSGLVFTLLRFARAVARYPGRTLRSIDPAHVLCGECWYERGTLPRCPECGLVEAEPSLRLRGTPVMAWYYPAHDRLVWGLRSRRTPRPESKVHDT